MLSAVLLIFPLVLVVPIAFYLAIWIAVTTRPLGVRQFRSAVSQPDRALPQRDLGSPSYSDPLERAGRCRRMARLFTPEVAEALSALAKDFEQEARSRARNR
jgi:hypothetical protein